MLCIDTQIIILLALVFLSCLCTCTEDDPIACSVLDCADHERLATLTLART